MTRDLIDRAEALAMVNRLWESRQIIGGDMTRKDVVNAIVSTPAVTVGVKPLVWDETGRAYCNIGEQHLGSTRGEEGRKAIERDRAARILAALDLTPAPVTQSFGTMICGRSGCGMGGPCMWEKCEHPLATSAVQAADDPECTDCGGSGVTYQTERRCSCQPAPDAQAVRDAALKAAKALREIAGMDLMSASAMAWNAARELEAALIQKEPTDDRA